jgi:hypothetical protein
MKLTAVYSARSATQAELMRSVLQSQGIPAVITEAQSNALLGWPVSVRVHEEHAKAAKDVVDDFLAARRKKLETGSWTCPSCGEAIEPQFTDCWNCQTPRPVEGEPAPPPPRSPPDPEIVFDVPCVNCKYNLKGLMIDGRCPECGHPVLPSVLELLRVMDLPGEEGQSPAEVLRPCLDWLEQEHGFPIEAIGFVSQVWLDALAATPQRDDLALAMEVRDLAANYFASAPIAQRALERWNLATPDKLAGFIDWLRERQLIAGGVR